MPLLGLGQIGPDLVQRRRHRPGPAALATAPDSASTTSTAPAATVAPTATGTSCTRPALGARTSCSIFIASTTSSSSPAATWLPGPAATDTTVPASGAVTATWPGGTSAGAGEASPPGGGRTAAAAAPGWRRPGRGQVGGVRVDPAHVVRAEPGRLQEGLQQGHVDGYAGDVELGQRPYRPAAGLLQRGPAGDHLGQQRVVARADGVILVGGGIDPHAAADRGLEPGQGARLGLDRAVRLQRLGVDPGLDGDAVRRGRPGQRLGHRPGGQAGAVGHQERELDQVQAGDLFGDRVLDLDPGVDLEEGERGVLDEELDGGQPGVPGRAGQRDRGLVQPGAEGVADRGRGDLDQLLAAPLQAAVTVPQHGHGAGAVADDLDLDVPGRVEQLLDVDRAVAEGRRRLGGAPAHRCGQVSLPGHRAQAATAAARDRLDHDRAVLAQQGPRLLQHRPVRSWGAVGGGQQGQAELTGPGPGRGLVAEQGERVRSPGRRTAPRPGHSAGPAPVARTGSRTRGAACRSRCWWPRP